MNLLWIQPLVLMTQYCKSRLFVIFTNHGYFFWWDYADSGNKASLTSKYVNRDEIYWISSLVGRLFLSITIFSFIEILSFTPSLLRLFLRSFHERFSISTFVLIISPFVNFIFFLWSPCFCHLCTHQIVLNFHHLFRLKPITLSFILCIFEAEIFLPLTKIIIIELTNSETS